MTESTDYKTTNIEKVKYYLDHAEDLNPATQPSDTRNHVYFSKDGRGFISLNVKEGTVHCSPRLNSDVKLSELMRGLLKLIK